MKELQEYVSVKFLCFANNIEFILCTYQDNINPEKSKSGNDSGDSNGELLFSSVIQKAAAKNEDSEGAGASGIASKETETKSLTDVAREYEESRAQKRKYEEVETFTGEEDEVNICDVSVNESFCLNHFSNIFNLWNIFLGKL